MSKAYIYIHFWPYSCIYKGISDIKLYLILPSLSLSAKSKFEDPAEAPHSAEDNEKKIVYN